MDNKTAERSGRGPVAGRKNSYGSGPVWSGQLAAVLCSLSQALCLPGLNPRRWLTAYALPMGGDGFTESLPNPNRNSFRASSLQSGIKPLPLNDPLRTLPMISRRVSGDPSPEAEPFVPPLRARSLTEGPLIRFPEAPECRFARHLACLLPRPDPCDNSSRSLCSTDPTPDETS